MVIEVRGTSKIYLGNFRHAEDSLSRTRQMEVHILLGCDIPSLQVVLGFHDDDATLNILVHSRVTDSNSSSNASPIEFVF